MPEWSLYDIISFHSFVLESMSSIPLKYTSPIKKSTRFTPAHLSASAVSECISGRRLHLLSYARLTLILSFSEGSEVNSCAVIFSRSEENMLMRTSLTVMYAFMLFDAGNILIDQGRCGEVIRINETGGIVADWASVNEDARGVLRSANQSGLSSMFHDRIPVSRQACGCNLLEVFGDNDGRICCNGVVWYGFVDAEDAST